MNKLRLRVFIIACSCSVACADNISMRPLEDSGIPDVADQVSAPIDMNNSCAKGSPTQTCWNFSDAYSSADLMSEKWQLGSCWGTKPATLRTALFPPTLMPTDSLCEANLPPLKVTNPNVTQILLRVQQTSSIDGLGNYASIYADVPMGPVLLSRTQVQTGQSESLFAVKSGDTFHVRLQLQVSANNTLPEGIWQIQRIEFIPYCNNQSCSL